MPIDSRLYCRSTPIHCCLLLITLAGSPLLAGPAEEKAGPAEEKAEPSGACSGGVIKDDGDPESGYGFVPNATEGVYLQRFEAAEFPRAQIKTVCVCLLKTRFENDADFEVVFYKSAGGRPADKPYASVAAKATDIPVTKETAGKFYEVDVSGVILPEGTSFIGARWNPSKQRFLFVCNDQSPPTEKVDVFYRENEAPGWSHVDQSKDPIFKPHRSILVRATAASQEEAQTIKPRFLEPAASSTPKIAPKN